MKTVSLLLCCVAFLLTGPITNAYAREEIDLNGGWKFIKQDLAASESPAVDDSTWQSIALPHTWNAQDGQDGGGNYYRGPGWYRRHLKIDPALAGKTLVLKFDGANRNTDVYLNGEKVGSHKGGFAAFCFDITPYIKPNADNLLAVRVDNAHDPSSPPLSADFTFFGGLYRSAHLLVLEKLSISPLDHASPGVFLKQQHVTAESAEIEVTTQLRNANPAEKSPTVKITLADASGKTVATASSPQAVPANSQADSIQKLTLAKPHLWNGRSDPYLYTATIELFDGTTLVDRITQPLGLRFFHVDPDKGFFLNGKYLDLHGVNRHQDRLNKGWAIGKAEHEEDFALIHEMGCNTIRLSHYQHAQAMYDLCDAGGLVVWAEIPLVNSANETEPFTENCRQQMTELIKQNFNHPSIVFWSCFNELGKSNNDWAVVNEVNKVIKALDPNRLSAGASCHSPDWKLTFYTDVIAFNKYFGWYSGQFAEFAPWIDSVHAQFPKLRLGITEYGAGSNPLHHELTPAKRIANSPWHPEEYQMLFHETYWKVLSQRPYIWGKYIWAMFDFAADHRNEGSTPGRNDKGMVTYDRKTRKDVFYFYKANWSPDPVLHITSKRFDLRNQPATWIKVYSNCDSVELKLNGQSKGTLQSRDHIFLWENLTLQKGENKLEALGIRNGQPLTDTATLTFDPTAKIPLPPIDKPAEKPKPKKK